MTSIEWIIPFALYPTLAALYYGGAPIRFEGPDNARQLLGVVLGMVIFLAVWGVLKTVLQPMTGPMIGLAAASILATFALRPGCRLGCRLVGVRVVDDQ